MLYLALSCLQGYTIKRAADELTALGRSATGLQLTPGNIPPTCEAEVPEFTVPTRRHQGFSMNRKAPRVWAATGELTPEGRLSDSVHPPLVRDLGDPIGAYLARIWREWPPDRTLEVMYNGYAILGDWASIDRAMQERRSLAVDVSHVALQLAQGTMTAAQAARLFRYDNIAEVHVSQASANFDAHLPVTEITYGLGWARERLEAGTPTVLECYMHKLTQTQREDQLDLLLR